MFKIQFWASSWREEKNWDIETEDPQTIHASRIILFTILLMLVMYKWKEASPIMTREWWINLKC